VACKAKRELLVELNPLVESFRYGLIDQFLFRYELKFIERISNLSQINGQLSTDSADSMARTFVRTCNPKETWGHSEYDCSLFSNFGRITLLSDLYKS
jgi:hypothetical protein